MKKLLLTTLILFSIIKAEAQCAYINHSCFANQITCSSPTVSIILSTTVSPVTCMWSGPGIISGGNTFNPTVNVGGTYMYTITNTSNGCTTYSGTTVFSPVNCSDGSISCSNPTISLVATPNFTPTSYSWQGPGIISGTTSPTVAVNTPGYYICTVSNTATGCQVLSSSSVYDDTSIPTLTCNNNTITCLNPQVKLVANPTSGGVYYSWQGPGIVSGATSRTVTVNAVGNYTCFGTSMFNGCVGSVVGTVVSNTLTPFVMISSSSNSVCAGQTTTLTTTVFPSSSISYSWSPASSLNTTTNSAVASPTSNTVYTVTVTDMTNGCSTSQTTNVIVDQTCQNVWPGDANSDGLANNLDVLELGLHFAQTGAPRASTSNVWQSYFANNWAGTITNGKNLNHSDCNGDGTINGSDAIAIANNYGSTHAFKTAQTTTVNPQLSIVPDQAIVAKGTWGTASIYLGDATTSVNNINGIAFTVDFDNTLIEPNSIYIDYQSSFMDLSNQNLDFEKLDFSTGKIFTATTHTVNNNVSGYGKIATLHYQILSTLTTDEVLNLSLVQANQSDALGAIVPLTTGAGTLMAIGASVGLTENLNTNLISINPNPTNGLLTITSKSELQKIEVVTLTGQIVLSEIPNGNNHLLHLDNFANGIYFVNLFQNNHIIKREKVILNK